MPPGTNVARSLRQARRLTALCWSWHAGALLVNTSSSELLDENALRCALLAGSIGGAALDSVEGFTWFEAWVRDLPNLVITPRSACFSDQAFTEQRLRGASVIKQFLKVRASPPLLYYRLSRRKSYARTVRQWSVDATFAGRLHRNFHSARNQPHHQQPGEQGQLPSIRRRRRRRRLG
jgi:phosphoglycerate dehydrogenase-like enzyme